MTTDQIEQKIADLQADRKANANGYEVAQYETAIAILELALQTRPAWRRLLDRTLDRVARALYEEPAGAAPSADAIPIEQRIGPAEVFSEIADPAPEPDTNAKAE